MITAEGQPFGATINTDHITNIRWQPLMRSAKEGDPLQVIDHNFEVIIALIDGSHSLTFDNKEKAMTEYFRLNNEVRGVLSDE